MIVLFASTDVTHILILTFWSMFAKRRFFLPTEKIEILFSLLLLWTHSAWKVTKGSRKTMSPYEFYCAKKSKKKKEKKKLGLVTFSCNCHVGTWSRVLRAPAPLMKAVLHVVTRWLPRCRMKRCLSPRVQRGGFQKSIFVGSGRSKWKRKNRILGILST